MLRGWVVVVDAAQELGDCGDAEEIVGVCEEAHPCDHYGCEMVPLRLGFVQCRQHLQWHDFFADKNKEKAKKRTKKRQKKEQEKAKKRTQEQRKGKKAEKKEQEQEKEQD